MRNLALRPAIPAMSTAAIDKVYQVEAVNFAKPQTPLRTEHEFHAGVYARTMIVPQLSPGQACMITGALVKIPTLLIAHGDALLYVGKDKPLPLSGYRVIRAAAGRKQAFLAQSGFRLTMIFATQATTVEQAEAEFTDEASNLLSRRKET